jgi:hypothetical protein
MLVVLFSSLPINVVNVFIVNQFDHVVNNISSLVFYYSFSSMILPSNKTVADDQLNHLTSACKHDFKLRLWLQMW